MRYVVLLWICFLATCAMASNAEPTMQADKNKCAAEQCQPVYTIKDIKSMLNQYTDTLSQDVINTTAVSLKCASKSEIVFNSILTIIDYSLPSNKKRLWVFDLKAKKLLHHTYVAHGIKSGTLDSQFFSNVSNSKASSLGVFSTENSYHGRYGLALKLQGLENNFNDKAYDRFLVLHAAWYVNEDFIKKYGRIGRSWGCPAIPYHLIKPVVDTIKDQSLMVVYYPSDQWLLKSKFLTCDDVSLAKRIERMEKMPKMAKNKPRGPILFADKNNNNRRESGEPVVVMSAENYQRIIDDQVPLGRMLRRQINSQEYIALNQLELQRLDTNNDKIINDQDQDGLQVISFVVAKVRNIRGYYATEFHPVDLEQGKKIRLNKSDPILSSGKVNAKLKSTEKFIRWLGL